MVDNNNPALKATAVITVENALSIPDNVSALANKSILLNPIDPGTKSIIPGTNIKETGLSVILETPLHTIPSVKDAKKTDNSSKLKEEK